MAVQTDPRAFAPEAPVIEEVVRGQLGDPFAVLGMQSDGETAPVVNAFEPGAAEAVVVDGAGKEFPLERLHPEGFFHGRIEGKRGRFPYTLRFKAGDATWERLDAYAFDPILGEMDEYLFAEGRHEELWHVLGAHPKEHQGQAGTAFAVWAPNARRVSVVGEFNAWDGRRSPMRRRYGAGLWELFIPGIGPGTLYKFEIVGAYGELRPLKADPMGFAHQVPPQTASVVTGLPQHEWSDGAWMERRAEAVAKSAPISIYEVHLESWRRNDKGESLSYAEAGRQLADYATEMGFTHVEFLPLSEYPYSGSWGYQPVGLFAPTSRFGSPSDFAAMVDALHGAGIGVILDWVPAHFPEDAHGLGRFDGTALYEHEDPRLGFHKDWNTLIYNYGRNEVANTLRANAVFWADEYHVDALRVDAVASMLYLDYSRNEGEWIPNRYGGRENLEAIEFLKGTNEAIRTRGRGAVTIAEESTAFPSVSRPVGEGGLGFDYKWNMGWMHDTLAYMAEDPINRRYHHDKMTFGLIYAFSENFVLPLSHDEVVHGKGSLLNKMPGDRWQKFANLRAYYGFMWTHPGKKLLFMGGEIAQEREWNHDGQVDWHLLQDGAHKGVQALIRDLNHLYADTPALHALDCSHEGFQWIEGGDHEQSVYSYLRKDGQGGAALVVCNMTPVPRESYGLGVPQGGTWRVALNTDAARYGGSDHWNADAVDALDEPAHGQPAKVVLTLPPLSTLVLLPE